MILFLPRKKLRIVTKSRIRPECSVGVKTRGPDADPSFKIIFHIHNHGRYMPPASKRILVCSSMARTPRESTGFIGKRIRRLISEWSQRMVGNINTVAIAPDLRTGSAILQVVFTIVFIHPCAFYKWIQEIIVVVF